MSRHRTIARALTGPLRYAAEVGRDMDSFHRAIIAAKGRGDTTPTLVYADWLEERGMPETAAHIREHVGNNGGGFAPGYYFNTVNMPRDEEAPVGGFKLDMGFGYGSRDSGHVFYLRHGMSDGQNHLSWLGRVHRPGEHAEAARKVAALRAEGVQTTPLVDLYYPPEAG